MGSEVRETRYKVDVRVDCATRDLFVSDRMVNVSRGGLFVEATLPLHSEVELVFRTPETGAPISAKGCVVWNCNGRRVSGRRVTGSGIKFTDMSPQARSVLEYCLSRLSPDSPIGDQTHRVWDLLTTAP